MKYLQKSFSVAQSGSDNYERVFERHGAKHECSANLSLDRPCLRLDRRGLHDYSFDEKGVCCLACGARRGLMEGEEMMPISEERPEELRDSNEEDQ